MKDSARHSDNEGGEMKRAKGNEGPGIKAADYQ